MSLLEIVNECDIECADPQVALTLIHSQSFTALSGKYEQHKFCRQKCVLLPHFGPKGSNLYDPKPHTNIHKIKHT